MKVRALTLFSLCILLINTLQATSFGQPAKRKTKAELIREQEISRTKYLHRWKKFPSINGKNLYTKEPINFSAIPGYVSVVVFIASWSEPSQDLIPQIKKLENSYSNLHTRFLYVFSQHDDTQSDALGAAKYYKLPNAIMADIQIKKDFHNPELPSIYVGDRHGWILTRFLEADHKAVAQLEHLLKHITAI